MKKTILFFGALSFGLLATSCSTDEYDLQEKSMEIEKLQTLKDVNSLTNSSNGQEIEPEETTTINYATFGQPVNQGTKKD